MKIINQLTLRYLKENKKRTILTILCIALSVVMISCVGIAFYSGKQFFKEQIEHTTGDYHYVITDNNKETIDLIEADNQIDNYYMSNSQMLYLKDETNGKETTHLKNGDFNYFKKENISQYIVKGKLPQNSKEICISKEYLEKNNLHKDVGQSITFKQKSYDERVNNEIIKTKDYTIVGIINEFKGKSLYAEAFNTLSYIDINNEDYFSIYIRDKDVSSTIFEHANQLVDKIISIDKKSKDGVVSYNSSYLAIQDIFEENSSSFFLTAYRLIAAVLVIIVFISLFIIYQAFNLSTNDRIQYLGMLSSVGATPKQKKRSVYYEGFILSLISIPLGIFISFVGLSITFFFLSQLDTIKNMGISLNASISLPYLLMVIVISLITIFISLYIPARRISKISVIDALKKNDEIKVKSRKLKSGLFSKKLFKINHQLAIKNYKRQGKRSKVIVFSLVVSMAAFIGIFSFGNNLFNEAEKSQNIDNHDVEVYISNDPSEIKKLNDILDTNNKVNHYQYLSNMYMSVDIDLSYLNNTQLDTENISVTAVDNKTYKKLCDDNNIQFMENQALIINSIFNDGDKTKRIFKKMDNQFIKEIRYSDTDEKGNDIIKKLSLFDSIQLIDESPYNSGSEIGIVVPMDYIKNANGMLRYLITAPQHEELLKDLESLEYRGNDYTAGVEQQKQIFIIIQTFIYGFVFIMILFTLMNIINMMSASIDKRKKEFAMMLSIGMSPKGIQRMILSESLIYGLKTLLYGVPLSIFIEYWIYSQTFGNNNEAILFHMSYSAYFIAFVVIMIVMVITFRFGLRKLKKQNIIESLKDDM